MAKKAMNRIGKAIPDVLGDCGLGENVMMTEEMEYSFTHDSKTEENRESSQEDSFTA